MKNRMRTAQAGTAQLSQFKEAIDGRKGRRCQRGVALAIVVWFIAGMSLLVAGIVHLARVDTKMAQLHVARAETTAAGDGAIFLMMADMAAGDKAITGGALRVQAFQIGGHEIEVRVVPTSGLIDLNGASVDLLSALFTLAGALDNAEAQTIANNVIEWRSKSGPAAGNSAPIARFSTIEDILRVEGVSRSLLDAVRDYVVVGMGSRRSMDWSLAPEHILAVVEKFDPQQAESVRLRAAAAAEGAEGRAPVDGGAFRVDARVRYGDKVWLRRRWVSLGAASDSLQPWKIVRTEASRVVNG
jgi:general secretion pathway protein K